MPQSTSYDWLDSLPSSASSCSNSYSLPRPNGHGFKNRFGKFYVAQRLDVVHTIGGFLDVSSLALRTPRLNQQDYSIWGSRLYPYSRLPLSLAWYVLELEEHAKVL